MPVSYVWPARAAYAPVTRGIRGGHSLPRAYALGHMSEPRFEFGAPQHSSSLSIIRGTGQLVGERTRTRCGTGSP